ncbi:tenascin-N isoform X1, partial [Aduncisulcus paluster]
GTDTKCVCGDYYSGADCTEELCSNMPKGNGACIDGSPVCYYGWTGDDCDEPVCEPTCPNYHGTCTYVDGGPKCVCNDYFTGIGCDIPICNEGLGCGNGFCVDDGDIGENNSCTCFHGYEL